MNKAKEAAANLRARNRAQHKGAAEAKLSSASDPSDSDRDDVNATSNGSDEYGTVQNAFLGAQPWTGQSDAQHSITTQDSPGLSRGKALREPPNSYSQSQTRYRRLMPDFVRRVSLPFKLYATILIPMQAERISHETGCWMYIILDHPGVGKPVVSFYSPRLRKDGGDAVLEAHKQMYFTFAGLKQSLKKNNADMATRLQAQEEDLKAKDARIQELEARLKNSN